MDIMLLDSRSLTPEENETYGISNGIRIDMVLDGGSSGIVSITPRLDLYTMMGDPIVLPAPTLTSPIRCYGIMVAPYRVPDAPLYIAINFNSPKSIAYPSTATPAEIKKDPSLRLSPIIDVTNVRFNAKTTRLCETINNIVGGTTEGSNKIQGTNVQTNVDNDVKHVIVHASSVMVSATKSLQEWIGEQYAKILR